MFNVDISTHEDRNTNKVILKQSGTMTNGDTKAVANNHKDSSLSGNTYKELMKDTKKNG